MVVRVLLAMIASAGVVFANLAPAQAALSAAEQVCQGKVGKSGRTYVKTRVKALSACFDAINAGTLPTGTDCTLEAKAADKLAKAESKLRDKISGSCPDAVVATLDFGGLCSGVATATDLGDCQLEEHIAAADAILTAAYDND